jgi:hypothetical protein
MSCFGALSCFAQGTIPSDTILFNTARNGLKIDMIFLSKAPCIDYSCFEFLVEYKSNEFDEKQVIGKVCLTLGELRFQGIDKDLYYNGVTAEALQLLSLWIIRNKEK